MVTHTLDCSQRLDSGPHASQVPPLFFLFSFVLLFSSSVYFLSYHHPPPLSFPFLSFSFLFFVLRLR